MPVFLILPCDKEGKEEEEEEEKGEEEEGREEETDFSGSVFLVLFFGYVFLYVLHVRERGKKESEFVGGWK
jgi:hypothetical protein